MSLPSALGLLDFLEDALFAPPVEIPIHGLPASKSFGQHAPLTSYKLAKAQALIGANKWTYLRFHFQPPILLPDAPSFFELLKLTHTGRGTLDVLHRQGLFAAVKHYFGDRMWLLLPLIPAVIIIGLTYLGCLIELRRWLWRREWFLGFFFLYLVLPGPVIMPRYHMPALPLMCIMAATVWARLLQRRERLCDS